MFPLPLNGFEPDGTYITIHRDTYGRFYAKLYTEDGTWLDQLGIHQDKASLLAYVATQYPHTTYGEQDDATEATDNEEVE